MIRLDPSFNCDDCLKSSKLCPKVTLSAISRAIYTFLLRLFVKIRNWYSLLVCPPIQDLSRSHKSRRTRDRLLCQASETHRLRLMIILAVRQRKLSTYYLEAGTKVVQISLQRNSGSTFDKFQLRMQGEFEEYVCSSFVNIN